MKKAKTFVLTLLILAGLSVPMSVFAASVTITAMTTSGGSISPKGAVKIPFGGTKTFNIKPSKGNILADVLVNGESKGRLSSYTFQNQSTNAWIQAIFVDSDLFLNAANIMMTDPLTGTMSTLDASVAVMNTRLTAVELGIPGKDGKIPGESVTFDPTGTSSKAKNVQEALLETRLKKEDLVGTWAEYDIDELYLDGTDEPFYQIVFRADGTFEETDLQAEEIIAAGTWSVEKGFFLKEVDTYAYGEEDPALYIMRIDKKGPDQLFVGSNGYYERVQ